MSLTHALLGLLAVEPRSGYELAKAFEDDIGRYAWHAGHTSIYPELNKMAAAGLVEVTHEGARGSRTYAVTPEGHAELRTWLMRRPVENGKVRNEQILRMFLLSALEAEDAVLLLDGIAKHTGEAAAELRAVVERNEPHTQRNSETFGLLAAEFGARQYEAVHGWALWAIDHINATER